MKRIAILTCGAMAVLVAIFGADLSGVHLGAVIRLPLLTLGLIAIALVVDRMLGAALCTHSALNSSHYRRLLAAVALTATVALVAASYVFFVTLGTWTEWPATTDYYDRLATAFRAGHLYVAQSPDPALLALPNPYDPESRKGISGLVAYAPGSIWDMSMYGGRVYLYWGPAPALLLLPIKAILPITIGDQMLTFAFLLGAFLFEAALLVRIWRRFFAGLPVWMVAVGLLFAGLVNPIPWLLFLPRIYEAAIAAGQFFLIAGLYFAFRGLDHEPVSTWRLTLAALAWVCAVGSRATLAIAVGYLACAVLAWLAWRRRPQAGRRMPVEAVAAFGLPLLLGAALLAWYNLARFGSIFEFGFRYAITMLDQNTHRSVLFSPAYVAPNLYIYVFNPPGITPQFPFLKPIWNGQLVAAFNAPRGGIYNAERTIGVAYVAPFLVFALVAPGYLLWDALRRRANRRRALSPQTDSYLQWFLLALTGLGFVELLVVFLVFYATMRYFMDAAPAWVLLGVLGAWLAHARLAQHRIWQAAFAVLVIFLVLSSIIAAILTGFSSDVPRLRAVNPALLTHLRLFFIALARQLGR